MTSYWGLFISTIPTGLRLLGIGRNQYIDLMNQCRSSKVSQFSLFLVNQLAKNFMAINNRIVLGCECGSSPASCWDRPLIVKRMFCHRDFHKYPTVMSRRFQQEVPLMFLTGFFLFKREFFMLWVVVQGFIFWFSVEHQQKILIETDIYE